MNTNEQHALHPRTSELVDRFAAALKEKLAAAEKKYGYSDAWAQPDWMDECRQKLREHIDKGDPRDVAAYCAFLWHHGEGTSPGVPSAAPLSSLPETNDSAPPRTPLPMSMFASRADYEAAQPEAGAVSPAQPKGREMSDAQREMPRYKCHKEVWALKIASFELRDSEATDQKADFGRMTGDLWLHPAEAGYAPFQPSVQWREQWQQKFVSGGYYVVYDDGYASYSPAQAFESGYTLL